jgi:AraC family transcriptional regulator of adaptative response / DNA-3-methyladenine glycosylase II
MRYDKSARAMNLDLQICSRARLARDARFDGKFFIGVLSTKIYCRPICRARTSNESSVRYFPTAAAAAEAGFRPCLRCRPECSPGTSVWVGTQNTVSRALRLIGESGLEDGGVEGLAERLGVGSRHLRRLFIRHLGATPRGVAHTRRLHFAKKLLDETSLPMSQVAFTAGFGSVRRFNAGIQRVYHRTPAQIRRLARRAPVQPENQYLFHLHFRPPYNWKRMLGFLALRATPGVEAVEHGVYRRSISLNGNHGCFEVTREGQENALRVRVEFGDPHSLFRIVERIRAMFDLSADWQIIAQTLRVDPILAPLLRSGAGLRIPGCWDGFELTVRAILGQQISVQGATTLAGRMVQPLGKQLTAANGLTHIFPTPEVLAGAQLQRGLPAVRAAAIRTLARAVCDRRIQFEGVTDTGEFLGRLREIPGIGDWTAQYVAMRALREPDAFPSGDLILRRMTATRTVRELDRRSQAWRPWRGYATMLLWQSNGARSAGAPGV